MGKLSNSLNSYKKRIAGKQWYHQRFDGCPMFLFAVGEAETKIEKRKPKGTEANIRVSYFTEGKGDWYLDMADIGRGARKIIELAKKDPRISAKLLRAWKKDEQAFEKFFWKEFPKISSASLSSAELIKLWKRYYGLFTARFTSSSIIDHFALGTDELVGQMLRQAIGRAVKESEFTQIFATATAPVRQSFINEAEIELLKIAAGRSTLTLRDYQKRYYWTKNNYNVAHVLDETYFQKELEHWQRSGKDLVAEYRRIADTPKNNLLKKQRLFKTLRPSPLLRRLIKISEDFTWWQDERKKSTYLNIHIGSQILTEIGRRTGYTLEELKYAVAPEIEQIIKNQTPSRAILRARKTGSVFIMSRNGYAALTGKQVEAVRQLMFGKNKLDEVKDLRGLSASVGKAIGKVRIIKSATEIHKVNIGDILVAVMTRPDYIAGMKKAAAIVTNEGGITSHAAIVSRELGIPCIIGTKIATEVFRDGDLVEVNANHGVVKKL